MPFSSICLPKLPNLQDCNGILTDSTVLRNVWQCRLAIPLIAFQSTLKGLIKFAPETKRNLSKGLRK